MKLNLISKDIIKKLSNNSEWDKMNLEYLVDKAIFNYIIEHAELVDITFSKQVPPEVSKRIYYSDIIKQIISLNPKYILISSSLVPIFVLSDDFKRNNVSSVITGAYQYGVLHKDIPVYVIPGIEKDTLIYSTDSHHIITRAKPDTSSLIKCDKLISSNIFKLKIV